MFNAFINSTCLFGGHTQRQCRGSGVRVHHWRVNPGLLDDKHYFLGRDFQRKCLRHIHWWSGVIPQKPPGDQAWGGNLIQRTRRDRLNSRTVVHYFSVLGPRQVGALLRDPMARAHTAGPIPMLHTGVTPRWAPGTIQEPTRGAGDLVWVSYAQGKGPGARQLFLFWD